FRRGGLFEGRQEHCPKLRVAALDLPRRPEGVARLDRPPEMPHNRPGEADRDKHHRQHPGTLPGERASGPKPPGDRGERQPPEREPAPESQTRKPAACPGQHVVHFADHGFVPSRVGEFYAGAGANAGRSRESQPATRVSTISIASAAAMSHFQIFCRPSSSPSRSFWSIASLGGASAAVTSRAPACCKTSGPSGVVALSSGPTWTTNGAGPSAADTV